MVVATGATESKSKKHGGRGLGAIGHIFDAELFVDDAALGGGAVIALKARGDLLRERRIRE